MTQQYLFERDDTLVSRNLSCTSYTEHCVKGLGVQYHLPLPSTPYSYTDESGNPACQGCDAQDGVVPAQVGYIPYRLGKYVLLSFPYYVAGVTYSVDAPFSADVVPKLCAQRTPPTRSTALGSSSTLKP